MNIPVPLPQRNPDSHKGDLGRILIVAGSAGMSGAAALAATCCLRSGAGLVTAAVPASVQPIVAAAHPSVMTFGWPETRKGLFAFEALKQLQRIAGRYDSIAYGPGVGRSAAADRIAGWVFRSSPCPAVIDADGLNGLSIEIAHSLIEADQKQAARVLTPHAGEFQRLWDAAKSAGWVSTNCAPASDRAGQEQQATELAKRLSCVLLLKGPRTFVTDGHSGYHNHTGNAGMASAGSGDCLTGIIAALLPVMPDALAATRLAAHVHGLAGDIAAQSVGQTAMTSLDICSYLPTAWQQIQNKDPV